MNLSDAFNADSENKDYNSNDIITVLTSMTFRVSCRLVHLHHVRQKSTGTVRNTFPIVKITETRERQLQFITYMLNQR